VPQAKRLSVLSRIAFDLDQACHFRDVVVSAGYELDPGQCLSAERYYLAGLLLACSQDVWNLKITKIIKRIGMMPMIAC
jgi:hypothetical protein